MDLSVFDPQGADGDACVQIDLPLIQSDPADAPGRETVAGLGQRKNELFHRLLQEQGVEVYPPAVKMVRELRQLGKKVALVTSSRNGPLIMAAAGLDGLFDAVIDGNAAAERGLKGKPSPDIFLEASRLLSVSPEVAAAMARGAAERLHADCAVSTTGIAGPGGGSEEKPVGLVYVATAVHGDVETARYLMFRTRQEIRTRTAQTALDLLRLRLLTLGTTT